MTTTQLTQLKTYNWIFKPLFWMIIALVIRMLYLLEQGGTSPLFYQPMLDELETVDSARAILNGATTAEPYFKAPGYSWIMAAVMAVSGGAWPWTLRALQHIAGAVLVGMAAWLAGRLSPAGRQRRWAGVVAGCAAALYAPMIRLEDNLSLDFWAVFFQSAMLCALAGLPLQTRHPWRAAICAGCMGAAAWLVRPTITVALPFMAIWIAWTCLAASGIHRRRTITAVALFLLPIIFAASGVLIRNQIVSSETILMPWQGGYNFYYSNKAGATGRYYLQSDVVEDAYANPTKFLAINGYEKSLSPPEFQVFQSSPNYGAVDKFWFHKTVASIQSQPLSWLQLMSRKLVYLFSDKEIFSYEDFDLQKRLSGILRWMPGRFGVVFPAALASIAMLGLLSRARRRVHILLWVYVITLGGGIALYYVSGRMRMPLAFPMIALAGCAVASFLQISTSRKAIACVLFAIGLAISWGDWWGVRSESMAHADLARMSNAAWHRGRFEDALAFALQAEKLDPDYSVLPRLKGQALYNLGHIKEAQFEFQRSIKLLGDETSRHNLAIIQQELSKQDKATSRGF